MLRCPYCCSENTKPVNTALADSVASWSGKSYHCKNCGQFFNATDTDKDLPVAPLPGKLSKDG